MAGGPGMAMGGQQAGQPQPGQGQRSNIPPQLLKLAQVGQMVLKQQQDQQKQAGQPPLAGFNGELGATVGFQNMIPQQGLGQNQAIYGNLNRFSRF